MAISREEVAYVARLARLDLTDAEIERFRGQLDAVLERARNIQSLDLDNVEPTSHPVAMTNVLRADVVVASDVQDAILANAPERDGSYFKVPRILEEEQ